MDRGKERRRDARVGRRQGWGRLREHLNDHLRHLAAKRPDPGHDLVDHHSEGVLVGPAINRLAVTELLGRHVVWCADPHLGSGEGLVIVWKDALGDDLRDPEIP